MHIATWCVLLPQLSATFDVDWRAHRDSINTTDISTNGQNKKERNEFPTWFFRGIFPAFSIVDGCQELNEKEDERAGRASHFDNPIAFFFLLSLFRMLLLSDDMFYWFVHFERWRECSIRTVWKAQITKKSRKTAMTKCVFQGFFLCTSFAFLVEKRSSPSRQKDTDDSHKKVDKAKWRIDEGHHDL